MTFSSTAEALMAALVPGSVRKSPRVVTYSAANAVDAWKGFADQLIEPCWKPRSWKCNWEGVSWL